jgi:DHA2 family multidrug resistance protein
MKNEIRPLQGSELILAGILLAAANFVVVLDTTIANVSIPHIAGGLAISPNEGTYVITSYAVAEAIIVPLTGWLVSRFGAVKLFSICVFLFGLFSILCGLSYSIELLVLARILQGLAGGPLMPLSQTLLMQIFPKDKQGVALALWSMTTLIAPIAGPILGGYICDNWGWELIFYINIPIAIICSIAAYSLLIRFNGEVTKEKIDYIGLCLLVLWVGALQIVLDEGKTLDWFSSTKICVLAVIAGIGLCAFLIWEFTHEYPVVDLRIFRHRGFSVSVLTISLAFGAFFGSVVLTPLWLQYYMGYTATWSGYVSALLGVCAVLAAPVAATLNQKFDQRKLVCFGVGWLGFFTFIRASNSTDMTYWQIAWPLLFQGVGMPFFFIPLSGLALLSVKKNEMAAAAGLMSFLRSLAGAFSASIVVTAWDNKTNVVRTDLVGKLNVDGLSDIQIANESGAILLDQLVQSQAVMISTNNIMFIMSCTFVLAAAMIWVVPKTDLKREMPTGH